MTEKADLKLKTKLVAHSKREVALAELITYYASTSRHDLRATAVSGTWEGWTQFSFWPVLSEIKNEVNRTLNSGGHAPLHQCASNLNFEIDHRWDPPCPTNEALDAAYLAMVESYRKLGYG